MTTFVKIIKAVNNANVIMHQNENEDESIMFYPNISMVKKYDDVTGEFIFFTSYGVQCLVIVVRNSIHHILDVNGYEFRHILYKEIVNNIIEKIK